MTSSETESPKNSSMKFLIFAGAAVLVAGLGYLGYITFAPRSNPCESLFEQTTTSTHQKIESLKKQGAQYLQNGQMQVISRQAQQAAVGWKSCCILLHEDKISFEEFANCQNSFNDLETGIERVNALMAEI